MAHTSTQYAHTGRYTFKELRATHLLGLALPGDAFLVTEATADDGQGLDVHHVVDGLHQTRVRF